MTLNVAVPLSGINDLFDGCGLLSPISPISFGLRDNNIQLRISPDFIKTNNNTGAPRTQINNKTTVTSATMDNNKKLSNNNVPIISSTPTPFDINLIKVKQSSLPPPPPIILHNGRNILDLADNIRNSRWNLQYAYLPSNNLQMFLKNRSQYHRLGANGYIQDYVLANCEYCTFKYPTTINACTNWNLPATTTHDARLIHSNGDGGRVDNVGNTAGYCLPDKRQLQSLHQQPVKYSMAHNNNNNNNNNNHMIHSHNNNMVNINQQHNYAKMYKHF